jgi:hemolysin activation/secretion protein
MRRGILLAAFSMSALLMASVADAQVSGNSVLEQRRQEERINAIREREERATGIGKREAPEQVLDQIPNDESPCFKLEQFTIRGDLDGKFPWLLGAAAGPHGDDPVLGKCLGGKGLALVLRRMQNRLIAEGYITTRVTLEDQDLRSGKLEITLIPGRIRDLKLNADNGRNAHLWNALPARPGDLLNLREIEQGLENLKGLPTSDADIKIVATDTPGESDVLIDYRQNFPLRFSLFADDAGTKATGKYQGGITVAYDNPTSLSDLFYVSLNRDLDEQRREGTRSGLVHYSIPFGFWSLSATYDWGRYYQTVKGLTQDYVYSGKNRNANLRVSRVVFRDGKAKTAIFGGLFQKQSENYIDDTEIGVQRRRTGGWFTGLSHQHFTDYGTVDFSLTYRQGTGALRSIEAPEEQFGGGTSRFRVLTGDLNYVAPFSLAGQNFAYRLNARIQWNDTPMAPPERFIIGGRYTVRGFDGESILSAERGWLVRNDISIALPAGHEAYIGVDYGRVGGKSAELLVGKQLAGAVLGLRGGYRFMRYELFVGAPIYKPEGFNTAAVTAGFNISTSF